MVGVRQRAIATGAVGEGGSCLEKRPGEGLWSLQLVEGVGGWVGVERGA